MSNKKSRKAEPVLGITLMKTGMTNIEKGLKTLKSSGKKSRRKGVSLHIGLNSLDPEGYPMDADDPIGSGWDGILTACEYDAKDMKKIADSQGFESTILLTKKATSKKVSSEMRKAARKLKAGDTFLLTYSGHGGKVDDVSGDETDDNIDETWCLFDRQFIDDELYVLYSKFKAGVHIFVLSDSCHSGTVTRSMERMEPALTKEESLQIFGMEKPKFRMMPRQTSGAVYYARWEFYDDIQNKLKKVKEKDLKASLRLISACQDDQEAADGMKNGKFTGVVRKIWANGKFAGSFKDFHAAINKNLEAEYARVLKGRKKKEIDELAIQTPNYNAEGAKNDDIDNRLPFSI